MNTPSTSEAPSEKIDPGMLGDQKSAAHTSILVDDEKEKATIPTEQNVDIVGIHDAEAALRKPLSPPKKLTYTTVEIHNEETALKQSSSAPKKLQHAGAEIYHALKRLKQSSSTPKKLPSVSVKKQDVVLPIGQPSSLKQFPSKAVQIEYDTELTVRRSLASPRSLLSREDFYKPVSKQSSTSSLKTLPSSGRIGEFKPFVQESPSASQKPPSSPVDSEYVEPALSEFKFTSETPRYQSITCGNESLLKVVASMERKLRYRYKIVPKTKNKCVGKTTEDQKAELMQGDLGFKTVIKKLKDVDETPEGKKDNLMQGDLGVKTMIKKLKDVEETPESKEDNLMQGDLGVKTMIKKLKDVEETPKGKEDNLMQGDLGVKTMIKKLKDVEETPEGKDDNLMQGDLGVKTMVKTPKDVEGTPEGKEDNLMQGDLGVKTTAMPIKNVVETHKGKEDDLSHGDLGGKKAVMKVKESFSKLEVTQSQILELVRRGDFKEVDASSSSESYFSSDSEDEYVVPIMGKKTPLRIRTEKRLLKAKSILAETEEEEDEEPSRISVSISQLFQTIGEHIRRILPGIKIFSSTND